MGKRDTPETARQIVRIRSGIVGQVRPSGCAPAYLYPELSDIHATDPAPDIRTLIRLPPGVA